jgi:hypothetical protein
MECTRCRLCEERKEFRTYNERSVYCMCIECYRPLIPHECSYWALEETGKNCPICGQPVVVVKTGNELD